MEQAGIREIKAHLSRYLKEVKRGDKIIITERGKAIACIVSIGQKGKEDKLYEGLSVMSKRGLVKLPERWGKPIGRPQRETMIGSPVSDAIIEDRR